MVRPWLRQTNLDPNKQRERPLIYRIRPCSIKEAGRHWRRPNNHEALGCVGELTNDLVYERLAPGILEELRRKNPKSETGNRKSRHHHWLSGPNIALNRTC
ncbi:MAG: P63C domain-containing protein [Limisphaerales bacterium]